MRSQEISETRIHFKPDQRDPAEVYLPAAKPDKFLVFLSAAEKSQLKELYQAAELVLAQAVSSPPGLHHAQEVKELLHGPRLSSATASQGRRLVATPTPSGSKPQWARWPGSPVT